MRRVNLRGPFGLTAVTLMVLAACAASPPRGRQPAAAGPPPDVADSQTSYDWHGLLPAPFGTLLKEMPGSLHEVLLFHGRPQNMAVSDAGECYAVDGAPPRFAGRTPDIYLLCFEHDRLNRIDAAVGLAAEDAARVLASACAFWLKNSSATPKADDACEGRNEGVDFNARLERTPGGSMAALSLTLSRPPEIAGDPEADPTRNAPGIPSEPP